MSPCFLGKPVFSKMDEFPENFSLLSRILCHYDPKALEMAEVLSIPVQLVIVLGMIAHDPLMSLFLTCKFPSVPRTLLSHPSILVLPMFTFYTFRTTNTCWSKTQWDKMVLVSCVEEGKFSYRRNWQCKGCLKNNGKITILFYVMNVRFVQSLLFFAK